MVKETRDKKPPKQKRNEKNRNNSKTISQLKSKCVNETKNSRDYAY